MNKIFLNAVCIFAVYFGFNVSDSSAENTISHQNGVHELVAEVNNEAVTPYDIETKIRLMALSMGRQYSLDFDKSVREQALESLIDDIIKFQEISRVQKMIKRSEIMSNAEIDRAVSSIAKRAGLDDKSFQQMLEKNKVPFAFFRRQIYVQTAWNSMIRSMFGQNTEVSDDDAMREQDLIRRELADKMYLVSRIYLPIDDENENKIRLRAQNIKNRINEGGNFAMLAQQFSRSSESSNGGWLGWVVKSRMSSQEVSALDVLPVGSTSEPIKVGNAYVIFMLHGKKYEGEKKINKIKFQRLILKADGGQITSEDEARNIYARAQDLRTKVKNLDKLIDVSSSVRNVKLGAVENVSSDDIPMQLNEVLSKMEPKSISEPMLFPQGAMMFVLWARETSIMEPPSIQEIKNMLMEKRLAMMAERYFRELKKTAYIKIKK